MVTDIAQAFVLALGGGWIGYIFAARHWRQAERRVVYRDYLICAHKLIESYRKLEVEWDADPSQFPNSSWKGLEKQITRVRLKAQEVRLIAPLRVYNAADGVWMEVEEVFVELVPNPETGEYDQRCPASYEWFADRRHRFGWGPSGEALDAFTNEARADLGSGSRFWRIRGDSTSYRQALPGWLRYEVVPRIPIVGRSIRARQDADMAKMVAERIPLRDPFTGEVVTATPDADADRAPETRS